MDVRVENNNMSYTSGPELSQQIITSLDNSLSKTGLTILRALHFQPHQQQKVLAANTHTSVTSLSNIMGRLERIYPPLLISEIRGRAKFYSLTPLAEEYISRELSKNSPSNIHPFSAYSSEQLLVDDTVQLLYRFQRLAGTEWQLLLDNFLVGVSHTGNDELSKVFDEFVSNLKKIRLHQNREALYKIYDILGHGLIVKRIESFLQKELEKQLVLEPLFQLEKQSIQNTIALIDSIFYDIESKFFVFDRQQAQLFSSSISSQQYANIFYTIFRMSQEIDRLNGDKNTALDNWTDEYHSNSFSLIYIAEKCCNLYKFRRMESSG